MAVLLKSEMLPLAIRAAGVVAAALSGLVGLKVLLKLPEADGTVLIAIVGWMAFMPLGQFGYGRPVYGLLRRDFEAGKHAAARVHRFVLLFARQAFLATLTCCVLGSVYAAWRGEWSVPVSVAVFALGLSTLNSGIFQRDIAYALSLERHYEAMELARRMGLLVGFLSLGLGMPVWAFGLLTMSLGLYTQRRLATTISPPLVVAPQPSQAESIETKSKLKGDARRFLMFTANELLLYILPLVMFTLLGQAREIVFTSIWLRLFQLLVLPMRLYADARLNRLVSAFIQGEMNLARNGLLTSVLASALLTAALLGLVAQFKESIFSWLGATVMSGDPNLIPSLAIWALSNTVQHTFGSFTLSHGGGFGFGSLMSFLCLVSIALAFGVMYALHLPIGQIFIGTGLVYGLFALGYGLHVRAMLRRDAC